MLLARGVDDVDGGDDVCVASRSSPHLQNQTRGPARTLAVEPQMPLGARDHKSRLHPEPKKKEGGSENLQTFRGKYHEKGGPCGDLLGKACINVDIAAKYNSKASSPSSSSIVLDNSSFSIANEAKVMDCSTSFLFSFR